MPLFTSSKMAPQAEPSTSYSIALLTACSLMYMLMIGAVKSFGVLYVELKDYYGTGSGTTSWINSVFAFLLTGLGPFANYLAVMYSFRKMIFVGGCLTFAGLLLCAFVPRMEYWYITYGVLAGTGVGLACAPTTTVVSFYFKNRRSLANGIVVAASGVAGIVLPYMYIFLIDAYSLKGTMMVTSAIFFNLCVCASIVRQPIQLTSINVAGSNSNQDKNDKKERRPIFYFSLLKNRSFTISVLAIGINAFAYGSNFNMIPGFAKQIKLSDQQLVAILSAFNGIEVVARISLSWLVDKSSWSSGNILAVCCIVGGISNIIIPRFNDFEALLTHAFIAGLTTGAYWALLPALILEIFPLEKLPPAQGLFFLSMSVPLLIGQPIAGKEMLSFNRALFEVIDRALLMAVQLTCLMNLFIIHVIYSALHICLGRDRFLRVCWIEDHTGTWNLSLRLFGAFYLLDAVLYLIEAVVKGRCTHLKKHYSTQWKPNEYVNNSYNTKVVIRDLTTASDNPIYISTESIK